MTLLISNQSLQLFYNNNDTRNSNNTNNNVYGAVIMAETLQEFTQIEQQVAGNLQIKPTDLACEPIGIGCYCPHLASSFIITQRKAEAI